MLKLIRRWSKEQPERIGACAVGPGPDRCILTVWLVQTFGKGAELSTHIVPIAVNEHGYRVPVMEKRYRQYFIQPSTDSPFEPHERQGLLNHAVEPALQRELAHRGLASETGGYSTELLTWLELTGGKRINAAARASSQRAEGQKESVFTA